MCATAQVLRAWAPTESAAFSTLQKHTALVRFKMASSCQVGFQLSYTVGTTEYFPNTTSMHHQGKNTNYPLPDRAISYGGAHKVAHLRGCFLGRLAEGFRTKLVEGSPAKLAEIFHTSFRREASSWEALRMLGVPAHKWDNEAWAGTLQGLPENAHERNECQNVDKSFGTQFATGNGTGSHVYVSGEYMLRKGSLCKKQL